MAPLTLRSSEATAVCNSPGEEWHERSSWIWAMGLGGWNGECSYYGTLMQLFKITREKNGGQGKKFFWCFWCDSLAIITPIVVRVMYADVLARTYWYTIE